MALTLEQVELRIVALEEELKEQRHGRNRNFLDPALVLSRDLVDLGGVPIVRMKQVGALNVASGVTTKVLLDTVVFDFAGDSADTGNNEIVIRRSGIYLVQSTTQVDVSNSPGASGIMVCLLAVNDVVVHQGDRIGVHVSNRYAVSASTLLPLEVGDLVSSRIHQTSGETQAVHVVDNTPSLEVVLLASGA